MKKAYLMPEVSLVWTDLVIMEGASSVKKDTNVPGLDVGEEGEEPEPAPSNIGGAINDEDDDDNNDNVWGSGL